MVYIYLSLGLSDTVKFGIRTEVKTRNNVGNDLPSVLVADIIDGVEVVVTLVIGIIGHVSRRWGQLGCEFPPLFDVPADFHINRVLKTYVIESIVKGANAAIGFLHGGSLKQGLLCQSVGTFSERRHSKCK